MAHALSSSTAQSSKVQITRRGFVAMTVAGAASVAGVTLSPTKAVAKVDPAQIKACVFDTFGTVVDWRGSVARQVKAVADAKGVDGDWFDFTDQWRGYYYRLTHDIGTYKMQYQNVGSIHRIGLDELLPKFGLGGLNEDERAELNKAWHYLDPWPDSVEGLTRLKKKFLISPASNSDFRMMVDMSKFAGLPWDTTIVAELAQAYKPDVRMYLAAPALLNLEPKEVLMCAAHNLDLEWARAAGLPSAHILRPMEFGGPDNKYFKGDTAADPNVDFAATSIIDLAEKLGA